MIQIVYRVRMPDGGYMGRQAGAALEMGNPVVPRSLPSIIDSWTTSSPSIAKDIAESVGGKVIKTTVSPKVRHRRTDVPVGNETWFCCECVGDCSKVGSGVVFDVRIDNSILDVPPFIACPICGKGARIGGKQPSDKDGYGSRADNVRLEEVRKEELQKEAILAAAADRVEKEIEAVYHNEVRVCGRILRHNCAKAAAKEIQQSLRKVIMVEYAVYAGEER